jgi:hypothetical protein
MLATRVHDRPPVGFLDDLKRQADAARSQQQTDTSALARNAALADMACKTAFAYLNTLAQRLNVLKPASTRRLVLDRRHAFDGLPLSDFRADARRKVHRGAEVFDHVALNWRLLSGQRLAIVKDFLPDIEQLEARLRQGGLDVRTDAVRNPDNGRLVEMRYAVEADFRAGLRLTPDHDRGQFGVQVLNPEGLEMLSCELPAIEIGSARLDDFARWLLGQPHRFLDGAQGLRRVEA